jgi:hypothetical protein
MRRLFVIALFVALSVVLGASGAHRHAPSDPQNECNQCVFAQQGVTPAAGTPAPVPAPVPALHWVTCVTVVVTADGRELYRSAPKSSPPAALV